MFGVPYALLWTESRQQKRCFQAPSLGMWFFLGNSLCRCSQDFSYWTRVDPYPGTAIFRRKKSQYGPRNIQGRHPTMNRQSDEAISPGVLGSSSSLRERQGRVLTQRKHGPVTSLFELATCGSRGSVSAVLSFALCALLWRPPARP